MAPTGLAAFLSNVFQRLEARPPSIEIWLLRAIYRGRGVKQMKTEEYVALGGLITIIASALALVIKQIESSRCTDIDCCGVKCKRRVQEEEEEEREP